MEKSIEEVTKFFKTVEKKLSSQKWFKEGRWQTSVHPFPSKNPEAITFHVTKKHWLNEDRKGIHVESYLYLNPKKRKKSNVAIHIFHHDYIPGTKIKRIAFSKPLVDEVYKEVSSWKGYKFRVGKYGQQPFSKDLNGTHPEFVAELTDEASRICIHLGPAVDRWLKKILN